jgi:hypothetical protein
MHMWAAFALAAATIWDRMPRRLRISGAAIVTLCGALLSVGAYLFLRSVHWQSRQLDTEAGSLAWRALRTIPHTTWELLWPTACIVGITLAAFGLLSIYLSSTNRPKRAAICLAAAMIPAGLGMIDGVARTAPYFSLAEAARFLNTRLDAKSEVIFEGALHSGSSLVVYLNRKFSIVNPPAVDDSFPGIQPKAIVVTEAEVMEKWGAPENVYLIVEQARLAYWQDRLTRQFHIFHQVTASGGHVVLSNQL